MRPMASMCNETMCKAMMTKRPSGLLLSLAGAALIAVGVLIFVEPRSLVWLAGTASVLAGVMLLAMASFMRRMGARSRRP
jgi:multidrug transporter EmrE-like cation transporter